MLHVGFWIARVAVRNSPSVFSYEQNVDLGVLGCFAWVKAAMYEVLSSSDRSVLKVYAIVHFEKASIVGARQVVCVVGE